MDKKKVIPVEKQNVNSRELTYPITSKKQLNEPAPNVIEKLRRIYTILSPRAKYRLYFGLVPGRELKRFRFKTAEIEKLRQMARNGPPRVFMGVKISG